MVVRQNKYNFLTSARCQVVNQFVKGAVILFSMRSLVDFRVNELSYAIFTCEELELYILYKIEGISYQLDVFDFYVYNTFSFAKQ